MPRKRLTETERRIVLALANGEPPRAIAAELGRSVNTVRTHIRNAYAKLEITGIDELRQLLARGGLHEA
ncbi:MAG TPA: helix-turn-helix transcriptional regulator [Candidatus Elarobacter sp.]